MSVSKELVKIPAKVGGMSMVGIRKNNFPLNFGNYFDFSGTKYRAVNMWAENLDHLVETGVLEDKMIEGILYSYVDDVRDGTNDRSNKWFLVTDKRINHGYLSKLCFTGSYLPPAEILIDMKHEFIELIFRRLDLIE